MGAYPRSPQEVPVKKVLIMGAAGRDFHNFNVAYRDDPEVEVVAFTATQIPGIEDRRYPPALAGTRYPDGIPIRPEEELSTMIGRLAVDEVVFAYSDVSHQYVMHRGSEVLAAGAAFTLLGPDATMLDSTKPVVAICAVRTGSGKSQTTRAVVRALRDQGRTTVVVRHPMPYGNLVAQRVQRFASYEDLLEAKATVEEREEYEAHLAAGSVVYAGVDYEEILKAAQAEADVVLWDGGNNDLPFFRPNVHLVVADPHRAGHETTYHPGETNLRMADVIVINKCDTAELEKIEAVEETARELNPTAVVIRADSPVTVDEPDALEGKRVLVIEDGPTLSHGEMTYGAGVVAARQHGAAEIVDPRPYATGSLKAVYDRYPVGPVLPAMGYSAGQIQELEQAIDRAPVDVVVIATPVDLAKVADIRKPSVRVRYELQERDGYPTIPELLKERLE
ncbi:MAG TPA: cyclic 2,3-diphosphoglycerate synthase [Actinomycetota bacterium]|jgi:predicted GTPase|nr:cyclic 2,3-diphosphoglycerate synthase [Actinomycetota bacterium]